MILIEPPRSTAAARRDPLNKRELGRFALQAIQTAGAIGTISILLTDDARIQELNRQFRKKNGPTDVLSFPAIAWEGGPATNHGRRRNAGDLAISLETAARQAESFGHSLETEVKVLILHGALHLAGFDHEVDSGEMAKLEDRLRAELGLPTGLIRRSQPTRKRLPQVGKTTAKKASRATAAAVGRGRA
jgi:probable rRNA maturation factor